MSQTKKPVLIELDAQTDHPKPAEAPPVTDGVPPGGRTMQTVTNVVAYQPSRLGRWFWGVTALLVPFVASVAAWNYVTALLAANPVLGWIATGLIGALLLVLLAVAMKELAGFSRLRRLDRLQQDAQAAVRAADHGHAQAVTAQLSRLYRDRPDLAWGRSRFDDLQGDALDAESLFALAEREYLLPLDQLAKKEVERASRQVATVTALVPVALADVVVALTANLRMIRRIAEIYGGRAGVLGSWRLTRTVIAHLVATGAVALGDDLIGSLAGGGVLSKLSRRFGEGVINGSLTARVGIAAMEVCRPLPFRISQKPSVGGVVKRAFTGLFTGSDKSQEKPEG